MKKGTPAGQQLDCAVKAGFFPARISSVSFFMRSFTQGFRFGFDRSGMRKVGCVPNPAALGTKGCAGSLVTGGTRPGTGSKNGPVPLNPTHPARLDEKSGGAAVCCAAADATSAAPMRLLARARSLQDMIAPPFREFAHAREAPSRSVAACLRLSEIRLLGERLRDRVVVEIVGVVLGTDVLQHLARLPAPKSLDRRPGGGEGARIIDRDQDLHHVAALDELEALHHVQLIGMRRAVVVDEGFGR